MVESDRFLRRRGRMLVPKGGGEDELGIFARFKRYLVYAIGEEEEYVFGKEGVDELKLLFGADFSLWRHNR